MSDLIKREDAIEALQKEINKGIPPFDDTMGAIRCGVRLARNIIEDLPSADRPQGEWIYGEHDVAMCDGYRCDRCGFFVPWDYEHKSIDFINDYKFCPMCGARMKGADDESKRD